MPRITKDLTNLKFGRLIAISRDVPKKGATCWQCICDCGKNKTIRAKSLLNGSIKSCGCLNRDLIIARETTHGQSGTRIHRCWLDMKRRCVKIDHPWYPSYGGRGITVCARWMDRLENFIEDMGHPEEGMSLDRINNEKGYEKENCRWATHLEQQKNTRFNRHITAFGKTKILSEWSRDFNVSTTVLSSKLKTYKTLENIARSKNTNKSPYVDRIKQMLVEDDN